MLRIGLIASLFVIFGQSQASIILKAWEINAVMKRTDSNCVGILSDQKEAATVSNFREYTIMSKRIITSSEEILFLSQINK